jgi:5'-methylthioadenosine phosphorylase
VKTIGIIGGSGLDNTDILKDAETFEVDTPYGKPTSPLKIGMIGNNRVVLIARHGLSHQFSPTEVNYRANLFALKGQSVDCIVATTACGSLRNEIERGDFVLLDQFIDFTKRRMSTFHESFANGAVHTPMADPFDAELRSHILGCANRIGVKCHPRGTVVTIEGPRFSTRAESMMFQSWGADVINMSIATEAALANELGVPYAAIAMSTDYDCWKTDEPPVSWNEILNIFEKNAERMVSLLKLVVETLE